MKRLKLFIPLTFFLALCVLLYKGLFLDNKSELPSALLEKPLPEFSLPTVLKPEKVVSNQEITGRVMLLNVWATWCVACKVEHPYLMELARQGVLIYGVNWKDDQKDARRWLDKLENPYRFSVNDTDGSLAIDLGVYGAPETFLIDKAGVIRYKHVGVVNQNVWENDLRSRYEALQKEPAT
ncbi:MAG: DsbE family thiol:disulfide interchange protein [Endozoicomonas sp.]